MLNFHQIASGSTGNAYTLSDGQTTLLIEAGISWKKIKMALDYKTSNILACLITHQHLDHAGSAKDVAKAGIDVCMLQETREALGLEGHRFMDIRIGETFTAGSFRIKAFGVEHDVPACGFFFLSDATGEKAAYISDTHYLRHRLPALDLLAMEINYSEETFQHDIHPERKKRLYNTHMSLETAKRMLSGMDLSKLRAIHLIHISRDNGDPDFFKDEIQKISGVPTYTL